MNESYVVGVVVGSLRKESYSRMVAQTLVELAPKSLKCEFVDIAGVSFFNQDLESNPPQDWTEFRDRVRPLDAVLFVTPEYNRSVPGVLKNAIDVGSRPYGHSVWDGKPAGVVSASPGAISGFGANHHLRQSLTFLNMPTLQQPEVYLGHVADLVGPDGRVVNESTRKLLSTFMERFAAWVERHAPAK